LKNGLRYGWQSIPSEMIAYAPEGYFSDLACSCTVGICKKKDEVGSNFDPTS
jgi:hypothetical protein